MLTIRQAQEGQEAGSDWIGPAPEIKTPPPGPKAFAAISRYHEAATTSHMHYYSLAAARARGSVIEDLDGNRFLDFAAGIAVCSTGHCHPKVVAAVQDQAANLLHLWGGAFCYDSQVELMEKLCAIVPGGHVFAGPDCRCNTDQQHQAELRHRHSSFCAGSCAADRSPR